MGLSASLTNAVSGLRVSQDALDILSRNVANQGTPGYHRQTLQIQDYNSENATYARSLGATRAFNSSLQTYYNRQVADTSSASIQASYLDRLQGLLGKPGSASSLDTMYGDFKNAWQALSTSPDDYTVRAQVVNSGQALAQQLNKLSSNIQQMRTETEGQIAVNTQNLNGMLGSLFEINQRVLDLGMTDNSRATLLDQRDRLVSGIGELIDVRADYRADGTVALMTRSGVGLIDGRPSTFEFEAVGRVSATSAYDADPTKSDVGRLTLVTPSGLRLDLQRSSAIQGGELNGLLVLRDRTLVQAQDQLDEIAAGLAQALSSVSTPATATGGAFTLDPSNLAAGNDLSLAISVGGVEQRFRIVNTTQSDMNYRDASGTRVIGIDFSAGATSAAAQLNTVFGASTPPIAVSVSASAPDLTFSGAGSTTITALSKRVTASGTQGEGLGLSFFVDGVGTAFTNNVDTEPSQKKGFAARISVNTALISDNRLLVQSGPGASLGDAARPNYLIKQLEDMQFVSGGDPAYAKGAFQLNGSIGEVIGQVVNYQGAFINRALTTSDDRKLTLQTVADQMAGEYGVNVDEEMARLVELQNAYAANARIVSAVKELLDALFAAT